MDPKDISETPNGEFHHFQLVNASGEVPLSISVMVHYNRNGQQTGREQDPISPEDIMELHEALKKFDGNYITAFSSQK